MGIRPIVLLLLIGILPQFVAAADDGIAILNSQCKSCHNLDGPAPTTLQGLRDRKGPDLFYAGSKYKPDWMIAWLQDPKRIRPAGMYYPDHIRPGPERDEIDTAGLPVHPRLDATQARAVVAELMQRKDQKGRIKNGEYKPGSISLRMGEMMFDKFRGCLACHEIEPGYGGKSGPEVYTAARRLQEDFMISYMRDPQAWDPKIFMPNRQLKDSDLQKFVHYFRALSKENFE